MVELMVTVVIIGIVMGITITESRNAFNRDEFVFIIVGERHGDQSG